jgi:uncharacterized protein YjiS (DUF1127 family)
MFGFIPQAASEFAKEWRRQAAIRQLSELNDHLLADIGLRRDQLPTYLMELEGEDSSTPSRHLVSQPRLVGCG